MLAPFVIAADDAALEDLKRRLERTRHQAWPGDAGWDDGTDPAWLDGLLAYWRDGYDWRAEEAALNRFHHHRAEVDGARLHLIREKGAGPDPLPLILIHGWPDSFYRFYKLIPRLADPAAFGADAADAFDVVVPSLPGYGFSDPRPGHGGVFGFGDVMHRLMTDVLGYERYGAHGGDWGSTVSDQIARSHGEAVVGAHLTDVPFWHALRPPKEPSRAEQKYLDGIKGFQQDRGAYALIQGTKPRSLAAGLNDSPAGLAAWIIEKFEAWSDCGGDVERRFSKDELLTNVMIYWLTGTIGTSFQPYRDVMKAGAPRWIAEAAKGWAGSDQTPVGVALFPQDLSAPPREWGERFYNITRWTRMPAGGHFAALEEPDALADEIRAFFRPLR